MMNCVSKYITIKDEMKLEAYYIKSPLLSDYNLSFGSIDCYDSIFVIISDNNKMGIGEVTNLFKYSRYTIDEVWNYTIQWLSDFSLNKLNSIVRKNFKSVAINLAIETYNDDFLNKISNLKLEVPVSYTLTDVNDIDILDIISKFGDVFKFKIGKDIYQDIYNIGYIQSKLRGTNFKLRLDANQGYSLLDAKKFLKCVLDKNIEHFEQLLPRDQSYMNRELMKEFPHKFILDESIFSNSDIAVMSESKTAHGVKLKLFKHNSIQETIDLIYNIPDEFDIIFGNGVQSYIATIYEMYIFNEAKKIKQNLNPISEINGILKLSEQLGGVSYSGNKLIVNVRELINNFFKFLEEHCNVNNNRISL